MQLHRLVQQGKVWQAGQQSPAGDEQSHASGFAELDRCFAGQGWPGNCLIELLCDQPGQGELSLLLPLLKQLQSESEHCLIWVDPPMWLCAPALVNAGLKLEQLVTVTTRSRRDRLWTLEQALRSGCCPAVLGWLPQADAKALRRLQLAAAEGQSRGFLFRPQACAQESSSAPYRLSLSRQPEGVDVSLLKRRGGWPLPAQSISLPSHPFLTSSTAKPRLGLVQ